MKKELIIDDLLLAKDEKEEEFLLTEFVKKHPRNVSACVRLGKILREKGRWTQAIKLHKSLVDYKLPQDIKEKIYIELIKDYIKAQEGVKNIEKRLVNKFINELKESKEIEILNLLYTLCEDLEWWEEAIYLKRKILHIKKESNNRELAILYAFYGNYLIKEGNENDGLKYLKEALKFDKLCIPGLLFLGDFYYKEEKKDKSIELWERLLNNMPDFVSIVFDRLENAYFEKNEFSKIELLCYSLMEKYPNNVNILLTMAEFYERRGEYSKATELLLRVKELEPKNLMVIEKLIKLYRRENKYDDLIKEAENLISLIEYKRFKCYKCGTQYPEFYFRCKNCKTWLSIR